jgi:XRE family transcriptional regulator, fatty acid utilization regulator
MQQGTDKVKIIFGLKIHQLRLQKGISLQQLARGVGFSVSYLNEIEKGKKFPKADKILTLAEYFEINYDQLVSLKLEQDLEPIAETLHSSVLNDLPLAMFGIEVSDLVDLMSKNPNKFSALINSIKDIARTYDITKEVFYQTVLRSYQELNENYFADLEEKAEVFFQKNIAYFSEGISTEALKGFLREKYQFKFAYLEFELGATLEPYCIVKAPKKIVFSKSISQEQELFQLVLLTAYEALGFNVKPTLLPSLKADSFEEQFNYFKAYYWAAAFLMPFSVVKGRLTYLLASPQWQAESFIKVYESFRVPTSLFMYRLTSVLSGAFGLNDLFLIGMRKDNTTQKVQTSQQMHLSQLHSPHGYASSEHYCRRWLSLAVLESVTQNHKSVAKLQISTFLDSSVRYLVLSLAQKETDQWSKSDSIGFVINEPLRNTIQFLNNSSIPEKEVGQTCERCAITHCRERVAPAVVFQKKEFVANSYQLAENLIVRAADWQ